MAWRWGCAPIRPTPRSTRPPRRCSRPGRPRSICAGRSRICGRGSKIPAGGPRGGCLCPRPVKICEEDVAINRAIADAGLPLIQKAWEKKGRKGPVEILTHCNAGWLAAVDWGTALAPVYLAYRPGHPGPCLGRRDPAAQPGRQPHRLGTRQPRRAAHGHRRQCRRSLDAAGPGRSLPRRHRPHHRRRATSPTRSAPISRRWPLSTTSVPFYVALPSPSIDWSISDGRENTRSSSATPANSPRFPGNFRAADWRGCG